MGTSKCWIVLFNPALGKITFDKFIHFLQSGWCKDSAFWAGVYWFHAQVQGGQLNYSLTHRVETSPSVSAFFSGQFVCQSSFVPLTSPGFLHKLADVLDAMLAKWHTDGHPYGASLDLTPGENFGSPHSYERHPPASFTGSKADCSWGHRWEAGVPHKRITLC